MDGMVAVIERAAAALPESSDLQFRLAQAYEANGRRPEAITTYEKLLATKADFGPALNNLAYLYSAQPDKLERAYELAKRARAAMPEEPGFADNLGWIQY